MSWFFNDSIKEGDKVRFNAKVLKSDNVYLVVEIVGAKALFHCSTWAYLADLVVVNKNTPLKT